jgi:hypothetical protein
VCDSAQQWKCEAKAHHSIKRMEKKAGQKDRFFERSGSDGLDRLAAKK